MHLTVTELIDILDRVGLVAFALGGVEVGVRRRLDVFGLLVMGVVTATGGGLMRDVIVGRLPLVIDRWDYVLWPIAGSLLAIWLVAVRRAFPKSLLAVADAAGLGAFSAAGALVAIQADLPVPAVVLLAILTATGGGVVRDLLADRVPVVLRSEVNATAAGIGGLAVWAFEPVSTGGAALLGVAVAALVRVGGLAFDLHLPHPGGDEGKQRRLL
ncbi:MAG: TRIC cation channel family protein [Tepidiformaceae bacterium]